MAARGLIIEENAGMRYGPERVAEVFYSLATGTQGSVHLFGLRMRFAFGASG